VAVITIGISAWTIVAIIVAILAAVVAAYYISQELEMDQSDYGDESQSGVKANTKSTAAIIPIVYGKQRIGGNIVYLNTSGKDNKFLHMILLLAQGECNQIYQEDFVDQILLDDKIYTEYSTFVTYEFFDGAADQPVCATLQGYFPEWDDPLQDYCYLYLMLEYHRDYFRGIPKVNVILEGKKLYDSREGTHYPDDPSTWEYSTNLALAVRDFMTNSRYGWGVPASMINETSFAEVATYFGVTKGWGFCRVYSTDRSSYDTVMDMLKHTRGSLVYSTGAYYLKYKDTNYEVSKMDLVYNDDDKADADRGTYALFDDDSIEINSPSRFNKSNRGVIAWIDKERKYVRDELRVFSESEYLREGDYRDAKMELLGCGDGTLAGEVTRAKDMALQLGTYYLERSILNRTITLTALDEAAQLEPHDLVRVTSYELAWTDQLCRIVGQGITSSGNVGLSLIEEADILYDDVVNINLDDLYDLNFPDRFAEPFPVKIASVTEELIAYRDRRFTRLTVDFTPPEDYVWFDHVEAWVSLGEAHPTVEDAFVWNFYGKVDTDFNIDNALEGQTYYIAFRVVNEWGVKTSPDFDRDTNPVWNDKTYVITKPILGHIEQPDSLTYLDIIVNDNAINIYSSIVDDDDVFVYELRLGGAWTGGIFLMSNETPNFSFKGVKPGTHSFYSNTKANNGLYGTTPQGASVSMPDPPPHRSRV
jgi:hypothetical protein